MKDADIITVRYTRTADTCLPTRRLRSPKSALAGIRGHVRTTAPASGGWRRSMHVSTGYATGPRISAAFIASSSISAWLLSRGSQELERSTALLRLHACVRVSISTGDSIYYSHIKLRVLCLWDRTLRAPNMIQMAQQQAQKAFLPGSAL